MRSKLIVIDDDPTGSQTSRDCFLLTRWDTPLIREALRDKSPLFFILSNTRALSSDEAKARTREICLSLKQALDEERNSNNFINPVIYSRSDSTLRGHFPAETDIISELLGPYDAIIHAPAFPECGRLTRGGIHLLRDAKGRETPVAESEFSRDSVFGYTRSDLPGYIEEKTGGRVKAQEVMILDAGDKAGINALSAGLHAVLDASSTQDLLIWGETIMNSIRAGKRFLFRGAAGLIPALADIKSGLLSEEEIHDNCPTAGPGVIIVGSHVGLSSRQLNHLIHQKNVVSIELDVNRLDQSAFLDSISASINNTLAQKKTAVVFTSREERRDFNTPEKRLQFGKKVSDTLVKLARSLPRETAYLVGKGGITSHDVLSRGLELETTRLIGQVVPGVSMVRCPENHPRYPSMPFIIFPGNIGQDDDLARVRARLERIPDHAINPWG